LTIYFQHVGKTGTKEHFPRTITDGTASLKQFAFSDLEPDLVELDENELRAFRAQIGDVRNSQFQVWGVPGPAESVVKDMMAEDHLLLLETIDEHGRFRYGGRILARSPGLCPSLSRALWDSDNFPIIVLMRGKLIDYRFRDFCDAVGYSRN
jgi:hypothetical protein